MLPTQAQTNPKLVISAIDFDRLEALADSLPSAQSHIRDSLLGELARAEVVEPADLPATVVSMNSRVRFRMQSSGEEFDRMLVYPRDAAKADNAISILSPVGTALLGLSVGETIAWEIPGFDRVTLQILDICQM
jgi:regulator of nucleoside diphosphate kinase